MEVPEFSHSIDVSKDTIYNILKGKTEMSSYVVKQILTTYPQISKKWLLTGEGEIYLWKSGSGDPKDLNEQQVLYKNQCSACKDKDYIIEKLNKIIEQQQRLIDQIGNVKND